MAARAEDRQIADTHAHVQLLANPALEVAKAAMYGVRFICDIVDIVEDDPAVFDDLRTWPSQARAYVDDGVEMPIIRFAAGCHPHNAKDYTPEREAALKERLASPLAAAVGEIGLDYHYDLSPREVQREVFRKQIRVAHELGLPVALHVREAHAEAFQILEEEGWPAAGALLHCFDLDWETLEPWIQRDCYVALGGALTFKRNDATREAIKHVPRMRLLTETDSPYMAPEPVRGMPAGPAHTVFTVACMQEVLGCETEEARVELLQQLMDNAYRLFDIAE